MPISNTSGAINALSVCFAGVQLTRAAYTPLSSSALWRLLDGCASERHVTDTEDERDSGVRGFGSALQATLRYLGASLGASQQDVHAERLQSNSRAGSSGRQEQAPVSSLGRAGWKLPAPHSKARCAQHFAHGQLCAFFHGVLCLHYSSQ